jgi:hypothetical protein
VPLGLSFLALILLGLWMLWLHLQPPMTAEIPVPVPERVYESISALPQETAQETVRRGQAAR